MQVAILHDCIFKKDILSQLLEQLFFILPEADMFLLDYDRETLPANILTRDITKSRLTYSAFSHFEDTMRDIAELRKEILKFNFAPYSLIITTSPGPVRWLKHERGKPFMQLAYIITSDSPLYDPGKSGRFSGLFAKDELEKLREEDMKSTMAADFVVTSRVYMRTKLNERYGIDPEVVTPPVADHIFYPRGNTTFDYYVAACNFESKSQVLPLLETFTYLNTPLMVFGQGSEEEKWREKMISPNLRFITPRGETERAKLLAGAKALFISEPGSYWHIALEALRMGVPVICAADTSASEFVSNHIDGLVYRENSADELFSAIFKFESMNFSRKKIAERFSHLSRQKFQQDMRKYLVNTMQLLTT